jgi:hypothetical protein
MVVRPEFQCCRVVASRARARRLPL